MNDLEQELKILFADGVVRQYQIYFPESGDSRISIVIEDGTTKIFNERDLFSSLKALRASFEERGAKVLCNGARVDAYPSGMSRSMGRGTRIYLLTHGKQARKSDLVDIFDYSSPESVGKIEDQDRYHAEWVISLGN